MTKTSQEAIIAILIHKLGGEATITPYEFSVADEMELTRWDDPMTMGMKLTAKFPPVTLEGEVVEGHLEVEG